MSVGQKKGGLGRGLDSLMYADSVEFGGTNQIVELSIDELKAGKYQPRTEWSNEALEELAESIRREGVISPVVVRPVGLGYEIIAGERRVRASQMAGLQQVPAIVRDVDDKHAAAMALIENIQRENLNPLEEAEGLQRLMDDFCLTHEEVAKVVGRSRSATSNILRLLSLEGKVKALLRSGELDMGHARALLALEGSAQIEAAEDVCSRGLSVRQTEALVSRLRKKVPPRRRIIVKLKNDECLEEKLSGALGASVSIRVNEQGKGRAVIEFDNLEHLAEIVKRITGD